MVLPIDAYRVSRHSALTNDGAERIDLAFIDPPYAHTEPGPEHTRLQRLLIDLSAKALAPDGLISLRHPTRTSIASLVPAGLQIAREMTYGSMRITWLTFEPAV